MRQPEAEIHANGARPRVVIVGGGFGGLSAARALRNAPVNVTLLDRTNHFLFQPLLYQVATGVLSPADIALPTRFLLRTQKNATVLLADVSSVDLGRRIVEADGGRLQIPFDFLILATGARHSYFEHPEWEPIAPGLKTLDDARQIRRRFLLALEAAEKTGDPAERKALLTFVVVGGGPTGVELAGMLPTIAHKGFRHDFRRIDLNQVRVILLEGGPRLLPAFPAALAARACRDLEDLGVQCRTSAIVTSVTPDGVFVGSQWIPTRTVFWAAGNVASSLTKSLGAATDRSGRVFVLPDLSIPGHPEIFVVGDAAAAVDGTKGRSVSDDGSSAPSYVPALAAAAKQMGTHAGRTIAKTLDDAPRSPFRYRNWGSLAVIGRGRAIADFGWVTLTGSLAFFTWLFVHLLYLAGFRNRLSVLLEWAYAYFTYRPGARLITTEDVDAGRTVSDKGEAPVHPRQPGNAVAEHRGPVHRGFDRQASLAMERELVVADESRRVEGDDEDREEEDAGIVRDRRQSHEREQREPAGAKR
jgi:NADH dehydrogenase